MKKLLLTIVAIVSVNTLFSQDFIIKFCEDDIEQKSYYVPEENIFVKSADGKQAFLLKLHFSKEDEQVKCKGITIKSVVGTSCVEKSILYIVLENREVLTLNAWNKFNCDSISYFDFTNEQIEMLSKIKISTLRFKNGRDFSSLTGIEKDKESFFIRAFNNVVLKKVKCD